MNQKKLIIKLLDAQREAHIRHCRKIGRASCRERV